MRTSPGSKFTSICFVANEITHRKTWFFFQTHIGDVSFVRVQNRVPAKANTPAITDEVDPGEPPWLGPHIDAHGRHGMDPMKPHGLGRHRPLRPSVTMLALVVVHALGLSVLRVPRARDTRTPPLGITTSWELLENLTHNSPQHLDLQENKCLIRHWRHVARTLLLPFHILQDQKTLWKHLRPPNLCGNLRGIPSSDLLAARQSDTNGIPQATVARRSAQSKHIRARQVRPDSKTTHLDEVLFACIQSYTKTCPSTTCPCTDHHSRHREVTFSGGVELHKIGEIVPCSRLLAVPLRPNDRGWLDLKNTSISKMRSSAHLEKHTRVRKTCTNEAHTEQMRRHSRAAQSETQHNLFR